MKWELSYKWYHLEESGWRTEHDIEAEDERHAMTKFLFTYFGDDTVISYSGNRVMSINEAVESLIDTGELTLEQMGGEYLYDFRDMPTPETSRECPYCHGRGRVNNR